MTNAASKRLSLMVRKTGPTMTCCANPVPWPAGTARSGSCEATAFRCASCDAHDVVVRWDPPPRGWVSAMARRAAELEAAAIEAAYDEASTDMRALVDVVLEFPWDAELALHRPTSKILLAGEPGESSSEIVPSVAAAWAARSENLAERELLNLFWWLSMGAGATRLSAYDLGQAWTAYVLSSDFPDAGVFLVAAAVRADEMLDRTVLAAFLQSNGSRFDCEVFGGPSDEVRCVLRPAELAPLLVDALDGSGGFEWAELMNDGSGAAPDEVDLSEDEKLLLIEEYLASAMRD